MRRLRLHSPALLACLLICSTFLSMITHPALGQSTQILVAKQDLLQAFQSIQKAEQQGASNTDLLPLSIQLNTALKYEESAEILSEQGNANASDMAISYAFQSIKLSTQVAITDEAIGNEAQNSSSYRTILAYTIAIVAAIFSTIAVLEANRIWRIVGRRRLLKAKIDYRER